MNKRTIVGCLLMAALPGAVAANNGTDTITFEEPRRFFVDCLSEFVAGTVHVTAKGHFFETPSGNVHLVDNWHYILIVTGESTGRTWVGSGVSPLTDNVSSHGEVLGFTDAALMKPLDDGPRWRFNFNSKMRFDENGDLISAKEKFPTDEFIRCLGPKD